MSAISGPLLQWLEDRLEQNKQRVQELQQEKEQLLEELAALEWGGNADPSGKVTWKSLQKLLQAEGWPCIASVQVLAVPLLLQQSAQLQDQDFTCPSWCKAVLWLQLLHCCLSGGAGQHLRTPVLKSTHLREPVVSSSIFWQKSYCFTCIPGAWNRRVRGEKCVPAVISDAANFCLRLVASVDHGLLSLVMFWITGHSPRQVRGGREAWEQTWKIFDIGSLFSICQTK